MSGHNKWSKIKREKAVTDSKKSQIFSKLSRAISVAAKKGGGDINANHTLRLQVEKAKEARMPKENIEKAINKGTGKSSEYSFEELVYEGYGPSGVAFMIHTVSDNKNRTAAEIRTLFSKFGGSLGVSGSTSYIFGNTPESPSFEVDIEDEEIARKLIDFCDLLDENDDVQEIYSNFKLSKELEEKL